jgi:enoyl-CoA hydratase
MAGELAAFPQSALRNDRRSVYAALGMPVFEALVSEFTIGMETIASGETAGGARAFTAGAGRGGASAVKKTTQHPKRMTRKQNRRGS